MKRTACGSGCVRSARPLAGVGCPTCPWNMGASAWQSLCRHALVARARRAVAGGRGPGARHTEGRQPGALPCAAGQPNPHAAGGPAPRHLDGAHRVWSGGEQFNLACPLSRRQSGTWVGLCGTTLTFLNYDCSAGNTHCTSNVPWVFCESQVHGSHAMATLRQKATENTVNFYAKILRTHRVNVLRWTAQYSL